MKKKVYKTLRKKTIVEIVENIIKKINMLFLARTYKCGRVVLSRKSVYFGIDKLTLSFYAEVF